VGSTSRKTARFERMVTNLVYDLGIKTFTQAAPPAAEVKVPTPFGETSAARRAGTQTRHGVPAAR